MVPTLVTRRTDVRGCMWRVTCCYVTVLVYKQFRGELMPKTELTMVASRAGLVMEAGSKVTYNGEVGVTEICDTAGGVLVLDVNLCHQPDSGQCGRYRGGQFHLGVCCAVSRRKLNSSDFT